MVAGSRVSRVVLFSVVSVFVAVATVPSQAPTPVPDKPTPSFPAPEVNPSPHSALAARAPTDPQSEHRRCRTSYGDLHHSIGPARAARLRHCRIRGSVLRRE